MRSLNTNPSTNLVWGPLVYWYIGILVYWPFGILVYSKFCAKKKYIFVMFFKGDLKIISNQKSENITTSVFLNASRDVFGFLIT